jgi:hypothetical protein
LGRGAKSMWQDIVAWAVVVLWLAASVWVWRLRQEILRQWDGRLPDSPEAVEALKQRLLADREKKENKPTAARKAG